MNYCFENLKSSVSIIFNKLGIYWIIKCFFSPLMLSADSCSFLFSIYLSSAFFVFRLITYDWSVQTHLLQVLLLLRVCAGMCVGMRRGVRVCIGVHKCALVCLKVCGCLRVCAWDEFSEYLLENRVPTSADFNTYPIRIFFHVYYFSVADIRFLQYVIQCSQGLDLHTARPSLFIG